MVFSDPGKRVAQCARDRTSGALGGGAGVSITTSQSDCSGQLARQELTFELRLRHTSRVAERVGLREVFLDLGQPAAIRRLGARVQQFASVSLRTKRLGRADVLWCSLERDKIQGMKLSSRLGEQS